MFGRRREHKRRRPNIVFVTFRLTLSLIIFAVLLGGVYSAYKQFSGVDPAAVSPKALISNFTSAEKLFGMVSGFVASVKDPKNVILGIRQPAETPESNNKDSGQAKMTGGEKPKPRAREAFKFALVADSHSENELLAKALSMAKEKNVGFVVGLGDYTEVGTILELESAKNKFDGAGIRYFITAGDHDLWDSRDKNINPTANITQVFGPTNQSFTFGNAKFIILDNSDNYLGLGNQLSWLNGELKNQGTDIRAIFVLMHEPLYHPSSTRVMGKVNPKLISEAKQVTKMLNEAKVKVVFTGDIHYFTKYQDPDGLNMMTIGAVASQRNTQEPRFGVVTVFEDGSFEVEDVEIR